MSHILLHKLGTVDCDIVEANPVVWKGSVLRLEYIRWKSATSHYYANHIGRSYFRLVDHFTGEIVTEPFGWDLHMGNAFVWEDRMIVTAVEDWGKPRFYQLESTDLVHWTEPRVILEGDGWMGYNTSLCRADGKFVLCFELGAPREIVHEPFTMFFAETSDLQNWKVIPGASGPRDIYTGGPCLRWFNGFYYLFILDGSYEKGFTTAVIRSRDLTNWEWSAANPALPFDEGDRRLLAAMPPSLVQKIERAVNINASDFDFCQFEGKLHCIYSWGNQRGVEFLARAEADCTEQEFCESFFD